MIRVGVSEIFPITVTLIDEINSVVSTGNIVSYEIRRQPDDTPLTPNLSGLFIESSSTLGVYVANIAIEEVGSYIAYITCPGFTNSTEEIIVDIISVATLVGCCSPEIVGESVGAIKMVIDVGSIKISTQRFVPVVITTNVVV